MQPQVSLTMVRFYGFVSAVSIMVASGCAFFERLPYISEPVASRSETRAHADLVYHLLAGEMSARRGNFSFALRHYLDATRRTDDPRVLQSAFRLALHEEDYAAAVRFGEKWRVLEPDNVELEQSLALAYVLNRRFEDAMRMLEGVIGREDVSDNRIFTALGAMLLAEMPEEAKERMKEMAEHFSDNARAQYVYAVFLINAGEYDEIIERADRAAALEPGFANAHLLKGWALIASGRVEEGLTAAETAIVVSPNDTRVRVNYARLLVENDVIEEALKQFRIVYDHHPYNADVVRMLTLLSLQQGDLESADGFAETLRRFPGRDVEAAYYKGRITEARGDLQGALAIYRLVPEGTFFKKAQLSTAEVYRKLGEPEKSLERIEALRAFAENEEEQVEFYLMEGRVLDEVGRHDEAIDLYTRAMEKHGAAGRLLYARAISASEMGLLARAEADFRRILQEDPENVDALNSLGYVLADHNVRLQEAKEYILRAHRLDPDNPAILDSIGWVEFRLSNVEVAEEFIRRAMADLRHPEVLGHLVEILCSQKRVEEARVLLREALAEFPRDKYLRKLRSGCAG